MKNVFVLSQPNLEPAYMVSVLSRLTRSPAQTIVYIQEEFEDTKGVIRIRISKKNRQHNGQKKKYKACSRETWSSPKINAESSAVDIQVHLFVITYL